MSSLLCFLYPLPPLSLPPHHHLVSPSPCVFQMWTSARAVCTDAGRASCATICPAPIAVNARAAISSTRSGGCVSVGRALKHICGPCSSSPHRSVPSITCSRRTASPPLYYLPAPVYYSAAGCCCPAGPCVSHRGADSPRCDSHNNGIHSSV